MKVAITFASAIIFLVPHMNGIACAQNKNWRIYSPPNKSFNVELPAPLRRVMSFEGEHGASLAPDQNIRWATCYAAIETNSEESRFGIIVINERTRARFLRLQKREKYLEGLSWLFFADDDETQFMKAPVAITHDGLAGKEYFYVKESSYGSNLFTRGRIFDTGNKTYVIVFVGQNAEDLRSPDAERFLNSFHIRKSRRNR